MVALVSGVEAFAKRLVKLRLVARHRTKAESIAQLPTTTNMADDQTQKQQ
ncbi:hypothetical protein [Nostoc sp.]